MIQRALGGSAVFLLGALARVAAAAPVTLPDVGGIRVDLGDWSAREDGPNEVYAFVDNIW